MKPILLRYATREDWPAIQEMHRKQQVAQGTNYELPYLFGKPINMVLVGIDDTGEIHNCIYVECVAEMKFVGCEPKATAYSRTEIDGLVYALRLQGFKWLECPVPRKLKKGIHKPLRKAGFECADKEFSHYVRDLR